MPSGSHGGSMGSHSSGGASFGGSSISGGGVGSARSSRANRRPFRMHFGTRVYVFGGKTNLFISLIVIALFFVLLTSFGASGEKSVIKKIKVDYTYYHQMIANAEQDSSYLKEGIITDLFYNDQVDKWYYTYEIERGSGLPLEGYTYSVYTNEEISTKKIGSVIKIAVNNNKVTLQTDSIPIEFKYINYVDDGEYIDAMKDLKVLNAFKIVSWVVVAALVAGMIIYMVKTKKREDIEAEEIKTREKEKHELEKKKIEKDLDWRCDYCGKLNSANESKCDACGAGKS